MELREKVALVTGAARGIGAAVAIDLVRSGARVALGDMLPAEEGEDALHAVRQHGEAIYLCFDVADFQASGRAVEEVERRLGPLGILVNNAGITRDRVIWKMTEQDWDQVIAVDLKGAFNLCRVAVSGFRARRSGKIVNVSSINALRGKVGQANYAAAKAGIIGLTKTLARELARSNVNVNAVAPGFTDTPLTRALPEEVRQAALAEIPMGRAGLPEDVAALVTFLVSERARHITGQVIQVDGGQCL